MDEKTRPTSRARASDAAPKPLDSQRGAALLALVLALALGSGLMSIDWMEAAARSSHAARRTEAALAAARDALVGYAASYPDQHGGRSGPGYLPCPDTSGNGSPNSPCRAASLGRLPWRRLGLHDPRDGAGERLWYALDRRFRANRYKHRPLNSETPADLVVDGRSGIAAVILAPGPALSFQDRDRDRLDPAQYLEGGNETPADGTYVSRGLPPLAPRDRFNDRLRTISRDELMAAAGRRALATARGVLEAYRDASWNTGVLPWLAPWTGPAEGALAVPSVTAGRLALAPSGSTVETSFRVTGSPTGGSVSASGTMDPAALGLAGRTFEAPAAECTWTAASRIDCAGEGRVVTRPGREQVFRFDLHFTGDADIVPPAPADIRRRGVRGDEWVADSRIEIRDLTDGAETGRGEIRFAPGPLHGALSVHGVAYPLGVGDEVPEWLLDNEWHRFLAAAVAPAFTAGGSGACGMPGRCLDLRRIGLDGHEVESEAIAITILAGTQLAHQARGNGAAVEWFEGENANPVNLRYESRHASDLFNDQVAAIAPPTGVPTP